MTFKIILNEYIMYYIFESLLVGIYSLAIFICFDFGFNANIKLFIVGFVKHLLGYVLNIHTYYCNHGYACLNYQKQLHLRAKKRIAKISMASLLIESCFEGCLFVILNLVLLKLKIKNTYVRIFILGVMLHIIFELLQLHTYFCKRCV
jgi:hypothetical protein